MSLKCKLEKSILRENDCQYVLNSVKELYLIARADVRAIDRAPGEVSTGCGDEVKTITLKEAAPEGEAPKWAKIEPVINSASFQDNLMVSDGGKYRHQMVSFNIAGDYNAQMQCNFDNLSLGEYIVVAVLASGKHILLGDEKVGLTATSCNQIGSGTATEFSGIQVTMEADLTVSSAPLSSGAIDAIEGNLAA